MRVDLEVIAGPETGRTFEFTVADSFLVGRSPKSHLVLDPSADRQISRTHFLIDVRPPRVIINDLESTNGTFVNGDKVLHHDLEDGDLIVIGQTRIRVTISEQEQRPEIKVLCAVCRKDVGDEAGAMSNAEKEALVYTCQSCRSETVKKTSAAPVVITNVPCLDCKRDLSRWACSDGLAGELPAAHYLCPTCAVRHKKNTGDLTDMGDYRILGELGRGGMGVVYKAIHQPTRRVVAIKQILPEAARDERALRLFDREIGVQSMLVHPNLVRVLERGRHKNTCFFAIEYLAGGDLGHLVGSTLKGPADPALAIRMIIDVLKGLEALHARGFVHRDLKPPNILLSRPYKDPSAIAKITDYGLAKSYEEAGNSLFDFTRAGDAAGSLMFMPPEQILDYRFVKPPADVYAIGVSLYYLLTGQYTVDFPTPKQVLEMARRGNKPKNPIQLILEGAPIPIYRRNPQIPNALAIVVDRAVQKDQGRRHSSAQELRYDLEKVRPKLSDSGG